MNDSKVDYYYEIEIRDIDAEPEWIRVDSDAGFNVPDSYKTLTRATEIVNEIVGESEGEYKSEEFRFVRIGITREVVE